MNKNLSRHFAPDGMSFGFPMHHDLEEGPMRPEGGVPRLRYVTGFEGTQMFGHAVDVLDTTEHTVRYK